MNRHCASEYWGLGRRRSGSTPRKTSRSPEDLKLNKWGNIVTDANGQTSLPGIFAGGDIVRGAATVILAMGDGKAAARAMDAYLSE